jgi:hypothetical protein
MSEENIIKFKARNELQILEKEVGNFENFV